MFMGWNMRSIYLMLMAILKLGLVRDLNPGPLAPKARIIPLDQRALHINAFWATNI